MRAPLIAALICTLAAPAGAVAGEWATTRNGKQVVLHDDGTWTEIHSASERIGAKVLFPGLGHLHWGMSPAQVRSRYPLAFNHASGALFLKELSIPSGRSPMRFWEVAVTFDFDERGLMQVDLNFGDTYARAKHQDLLVTELKKVLVSTSEQRQFADASALEWSDPTQSTVLYLEPGTTMQVRVRRQPPPASDS